MLPRSSLILLAVSALLHAYVGVRLLPHLPGGAAVDVGGTLFLALSAVLTPAPLIFRVSRRGRDGEMLAWTGYLLMGLFSSLLVLTWVREALLLAAWVANAVEPGLVALDALRRYSALAVVLVTGLVTVIGLFNARRRARVVDVDIPIAGLPDDLDGFTIVQISDLHVGPTIKRGYLDAIVRKVNALSADVVAITGDVVDGSVARLKAHVEPLGRLVARHGVYCVTGNHEYYSGVESWIAEWRRLGLRVLLNQNAVVGEEGARVLIAGVTDYSAHHYADAHRSDPGAALHGAPRDVAVKVLLAHQPRSASAAARAGFDVQLSGHTHGGQFLPWNWFVRFQQPFTAGLHRLHSLWVYTSRGTGYWGPPVRFCAPSEITRVRLVVG
ncbi:MAG TPA: metallophosphoesterase [Nevskiaceae bacterium]|nr:metallophosphoesterase [Nevskiaceae bacterium]